MPRRNYSSVEGRKRIDRELARINEELDVLEAELHALWLEQLSAGLADENGSNDTEEQLEEQSDGRAES